MQKRAETTLTESEMCMPQLDSCKSMPFGVLSQAVAKDM